MTRADLIALAEAVEAENETAITAACRKIATAHRDRGEYFDAHTVVKASDGDLNAALALHKALLPEWMLPCIVSHYVNGKDGVTVELYQRTGDGEVIATGDDMARTWLLAILHAKIEEVE